MKWANLYTPIIRWLLKSPLHRLLSDTLILITVTGRKSGKRYTIPVEYVRSGLAVYVLSRPERVWWRNLRDGASVMLQLRGEAVAAQAEATLGDVEAFQNAIGVYLAQYPKRATMLGIGRGDNGALREVDIVRAANEWIMITAQFEVETEDAVGDVATA